VKLLEELAEFTKDAYKRGGNENRYRIICDIDCYLDDVKENLKWLKRSMNDLESEIISKQGNEYGGILWNSVEDEQEVLDLDEMLKKLEEL